MSCHFETKEIFSVTFAQTSSVKLILFHFIIACNVEIDTTKKYFKLGLCCVHMIDTVITVSQLQFSTNGLTFWEIRFFAFFSDEKTDTDLIASYNQLLVSLA